MRLLLLFLLSTGLYSADSSKETCYTVQLISKYNTSENKKLLEEKEYLSSCKLMEIGKLITIRCGCFKERSKTKAIVDIIKNDYEAALVMKTYSYRFDDIVEKEETKVIEKPQKKDIEVAIEVVQDIPKVKKKKKKIKKIAPPVEEIENIIVLEEEKVEEVKELKLEKKKVKKKKKKKKVKKNVPIPVEIEDILIVVEKEKVEELKEEEKKVKKKKRKYVKRRAQRYFYDKYLYNLESRKGVGKYDYRYRFGAQLSYDFVAVDEVPEQYNDKDWRRVRAFHKGSFFNEKLFYEIEYSFLGEGAYKDLFIGYENRFKAINTDYRIKVGNIKIPFSLETYTSSKYTMFMERALTDAFSMGRKVGAELLLSTKLGDARVNTFLSAFSNSVEERKDDEVDLPGYSTRLTYGYKFGKYHLFSLGGAYLTQDIKQENIKYKQAVESDFMRDEFVSTRVKDIDSVKKRNFELLYINHKFSLQAEYVQVSLDALKDSYSFDAYYIQGSYFLLGVGRKYKFSNSTMANVKPYAQGALELAFRYSYINLNDKDEQGGTQLDYNYGLNWYISKELKATLNYVVAQPKTESYDGLLQVLQARVLFAF